MIVEMAGRPAEHLTTTLENHIKILNDVNDITVHSIKVSEPKVIEQEGATPDSEMFTAFAEADFECENFSRLSETMFDFMPSSVEVVEPAKVVMDANEATGLLNNISGRLHRYDEIMKIAGNKIYKMEAMLQGAQKALMDKDAELVKLKGKPKKVVKKKTPVKNKKKVVKKKK